MRGEDEEKLTGKTPAGKADGAGADSDRGKEKDYRYCVLYTPALAQDKLRRVLKEKLPEDRGTVFSPCMETYRRDSGGELRLKAIFPGYLFIRSDMNAGELHEFILAHRRVFMSFIRELRLSERMVYGGSSPVESGENYEYSLSDLRKDETEFLDFLLDIGGTGGEVSDEVRKALVEKEGEEPPTEGLLRMSYGYKEKDKWKVVKGPLRAYEDHIAAVRKHDKKAYLDFEIGGRVVRAGFDVKPKKYWFPDDEDAPAVLEDGSEVDLEALKRSLMGIKKAGK